MFTGFSTETAGGLLNARHIGQGALDAILEDERLNCTRFVECRADGMTKAPATGNVINGTKG